MAIVFQQHKAATTANTNNVTTVAADFSACNFVAIIVTSSGGSNNTPTDSVGGITWNPRTRNTLAARAIRVWWATGSTFGASMTFTQSETGTFMSIAAIGFSGVDTVTTYDSNENTNNGVDVTTLTSGSVTPSMNGCVIINATTLEDNGSGVSSGSLDSGYTTLGSSSVSGQESISYGYLIQSTAGASNPTWTYNLQNHVAITCPTVFRPAAAGGSSKRPKGPNVVDTQFHSSYREKLKKPTLEEIMYYNKRKAA